MYLHRLIYYSRNAINPQERPVADEIKSILQASRRKNPPKGLTGALQFNGTYFAQVLEGDRKAITSAFCRIANDPRHSDVVMMEARPITKRRFTDWSMAFSGHSEVLDELYVKYGLTVEFDPSKMTADSLLGFMEERIEHNDRVARTGTDPAAIAAARKAMA